MLLIGIDCATEEAKVGVACGRIKAGKVVLHEAAVCREGPSPAERIATWVRQTREPVLLAIDAPLGWPQALGQRLATHQAGDTIPVDANELFRRRTDRFIKERLGKTPLDVGADRIARTAHAALRLLGDLRQRLGNTIPLAWAPENPYPLSAIEVYPAATLLGRGVRADGYKKPINGREREEILHHLASDLDVGPHHATLAANADALDAAVCVIAAADFATGQSAAPAEGMESVRTEGWIWARLPTGA